MRSYLLRLGVNQWLNEWVFIGPIQPSTEAHILAESFKRTAHRSHLFISCLIQRWSVAVDHAASLDMFLFDFVAPDLCLSSRSVQPPTRWRFISGSGVFPVWFKIHWCNHMSRLFIYLFIAWGWFWIRMCSWFLTHPCIYSTGTVTEKALITAVCDFHYLSLWICLTKARKRGALVILKLSSSERNHKFRHFRRTDKSTGRAGGLF